MLLRGVRTPPKWCDTPPLALSFRQAHLCDTYFATYRAIIVRYPRKTGTKELTILSLQVLRDMKSIAAGPLSVRLTPRACTQENQANLQGEAPIVAKGDNLCRSASRRLAWPSGSPPEFAPSEVSRLVGIRAWIYQCAK